MSGKPDTGRSGTGSTSLRPAVADRIYKQGLRHGLLRASELCHGVAHSLILMDSGDGSMAAEQCAMECRKEAYRGQGEPSQG